VLNWTGSPDDPEKDLMVIDSTMNGEYHFGIFVYGGAGAALHIRPENPVPIDGFAVMIVTEIQSQGIADPAPFKSGERKAGIGLLLDGTQAPITCNRFDFIGGILNVKTCIESLGAFVQNHFNCLHLNDYTGLPDAREPLDAYFTFYNQQRPHQALGYATPENRYCSGGLA